MSGTVDFYADGVSLPICTTNTWTGNDVSCSVDPSKFYLGPLSAGSRQLTAHYSGAGNYKSSDTTVAQTVAIGAATTTVSATIPSTTELGRPITFSAQLSSGSFGSFSGTVAFVDTTASPNRTLATASVNGSGLASVDTTSSVFYDATDVPLPLGSRSVQAQFSPDPTEPNSNYAAGNSTPASSITVTAARTNLALSATPLTAVGAQTVTFTASADLTFGRPTGNVTLTIVHESGPNSTCQASIGTGAVSLTSSSCSLSPGSNTVTATLPANTNYQPSTSSPAVTVNVVAPTLTTLTAPASVVVGGTATLSVTVSCPSCGPVTPTGTVRIEVNGTALSPIDLAIGTSQDYTVTVGGSSPWVVGSNAVIARYQGSASLAPSDSAVGMVRVQTSTSTTVRFSPAPTVDHGTALPSRRT